LAYASKIVLHCRSHRTANLDELVETFLRDGVRFVGVVGVDASFVEGVIDAIVVGDESDGRRFILTSSHPNESVEDAIEFARSLKGEYAGEVQVVEV
jgi:hypothetical protein